MSTPFPVSDQPPFQPIQPTQQHHSPLHFLRTLLHLQSQKICCKQDDGFGCGNPAVILTDLGLSEGNGMECLDSHAYSK